MVKLDTFVCTTCGKSYPIGTRDWRCACGGFFELGVRPPFDAAAIDGAQPGLWRYRALLPLDPRWVPVTLGEAALGAKIDLPTPQGVISLKIPPGTSSGKRLRLKGLGVPGAAGNGDLYAEIQIVLPPELSPEDLERIRQLDRGYTEDPRSELKW